MIPYAIDPSLHAGEPESQLLEDGFSAPRAQGLNVPFDHDRSLNLEDALASQSEF